MIVLNLSVNSHKTIEKKSSGDSSTLIYAAPKNAHRVSVKSQNETSSENTQEKTILSSEQKAYLQVYETLHEKLFSVNQQQSEAKSVNQKSENSTAKDINESIDLETIDTKTNTVDSEIESSEVKKFSNQKTNAELYIQDEHAEYPSEIKELKMTINEIRNTETENANKTLNKLRWYQKIIEFIKNIFKRNK